VATVRPGAFRLRRPAPGAAAWLALPAVLLSLFLTGCSTPGARPANVITLGPRDHDRIIRAEQGEIIEIRLPAAAPGGPRWDIDRLDTPALALAGPPEFVPAPGATPGALGTAVFRVRAVRPGQAMVRLVYRHPWEQAVKGETFLAMVHVR
jgi:inhibitor of cysteine peptidase